MRIKNLPSIESMNGSQDALVIEQTDGSEDKSRKVSPAQIKQYVLGNSIDDIYSVMGQMGAKNLIPYPFYETTKTTNGITFTDNGDGTITVNGTASANAQFNVRHRPSKEYMLPIGSYILSGCPSGGSVSSYRLRASYTDSSDQIAYFGEDYGGSLRFDVTPDIISQYYSVGIFITINKGQVCNNLIFKPMLRLASDTDDTYQPYAKTNRQLTEVIGDLSQTGLTGDSVSDQLEKLNDDIEGLILSDNSTGVIAVDGTYQIPTEMLSKNIIVLSINRAATCGSIVLPTFQITRGNCASGVKIIAGYGSNPTADICAVLTISTTGLITLKYLNNWSPVYVVLRAI